jgi:DNA-binding response OmpR family regulator
MKKKILIIDDDEQARKMMRLTINPFTYDLEEAATGLEGLEKVAQGNPDLILLDINMPGISGLEVCRKLREQGFRTPIIMLTAESDVIDKVVGLEVGADDYVTKPFNMHELLARIGAHLRHEDRPTTKSASDNEQRDFEGLSLNTSSRQVWIDGQEVSVTVIEFDLLTLLSSKPNHVFSRHDILEKVWGYTVELETRTIDAHVYRLRKKLGDDAEEPKYIHSIPGIGYRFSAKD